MKYYEEFKRKETSHMQKNEADLSGFITSCVRTAFCNILLKEREKGREYEEEDINSYWMTFRKRKDTGI